MTAFSLQTSRLADLVALRGTRSWTSAAARLNGTAQSLRSWCERRQLPPSLEAKLRRTEN